MRVISALNELQKTIRKEIFDGKTIGFVPTMGALHDGHIRLVNESKKQNDITVVSIFVNPLQFNNVEDLQSYPRALDEDLLQLDSSNVDIVFTPEAEEFYSKKPIVSIDFGNLSRVMEGKFRKGHFEGVALVVSKLLHLVLPNRAYFGKKDLQQFLLVKRMCEDLSFPTEIIGVDTVREKSGLAMSSRNRRLSGNGLDIAARIYMGLERIQKGIAGGEELHTVLEETNRFYRSIEGLEIEYLEVVNAENLTAITSYKNVSELAVCIAGYVEGVRLIDNLYLRLK